MSATMSMSRREKAARSSSASFAVGDVVAALGIAEKMLDALGDPAHRAVQPLRGQGRQRVFAIGEQLGAKAAADVRRHHAKLLRRDLENVGREHVADGMAALAAERQRDAIARGVVFGDDRRGCRDSW